MKPQALKKLEEGRDRMDETLQVARCIHMVEVDCPKCGEMVPKSGSNPYWKCPCGWESNRPNGDSE